jgi:hypothetical protein
MPPGRRIIRNLTILDLLIVTAGAAVGVWLIADWIKAGLPDTEEAVLMILAFSLGGLSLAGPPLLLWRRYLSGGRRLRLGELFWFCQGTASWLLWPPVIYVRMQDKKQIADSMSAICYFYGTPLMALYIVLTLLAGGWLGRRRRRPRRRHSWTEVFGLLLGLAWACTGLYVLSMLYRKDFFGR